MLSEAFHDHLLPDGVLYDTWKEGTVTFSDVQLFEASRSRRANGNGTVAALEKTLCGTAKVLFLFCIKCFGHSIICYCQLGYPIMD